ncbi:uncharacterized protein LOC132700963 [Cylas formicarius]|uniref:uncharacterized protein LOC132700963 n=1 Tax=Cylas formicarius TaxID=197179 RepID=UPI00295834E6|nr:uncharacterized protein LOC132700963 [Cylas formicarius]
MCAEFKLLVSAVVVFLVVSWCDADDVQRSVVDPKEQFVGRMVEQGRTLVHHAVKRFMIILPAIFFKLGIAFTLLVLVAVVAVNNGFIGFLLLVVGLSSVLARLQESRKPSYPTAPYISPLPPYYHHRFLDRSDNAATDKSVPDAGTYAQYSPVQYYSKVPAGTYAQGYYAQNVS